MSGKEAVDRSSTDDNFNFKLNPLDHAPPRQNKGGNYRSVGQEQV
jgi:hypothetical protein